MIPNETTVQVTAAVSAASAGTAWVGVLHEANEVLIFVATIVAIATGAWNLWDKYKIKREKNGNTSKPKGDSSSEGEP